MLPFLLYAVLLAQLQTPQKQVTAAGQATVNPLTEHQIWTQDGTYTDPKHGVSFRYPSAWRAETQFGYHPPADEAKPIAGFGYEDPEEMLGPFAATTLGGFKIVYAAVPAASKAACEAKAAAMAEKPGHKTVRFGRRSYSTYETGEWGMSQSTDGTLYSTYAGGTCYFFETSVAGRSEDVEDGVHAITDAQSRSIDWILLKVMRSVRIVPALQ